MKKIQLLGISLVALCAFSAFIATAAFAAEWLAKAEKITVALEATTTGSLAFENTEKKAGFLCTGIFDQTVGPGAADEVTKVLTAGGAEVAELDEEKATGGVACVSDGKTCESGEIWGLNLPFKTEVVLTSGGLIEDLVLENSKKLFPAYFLLCLVLGFSVDELCTAVAGSTGKLLNLATDVEPTGSIEPKGTCGSVTNIGLISADPEGLTALVNGEPLQVSE